MTSDEISGTPEWMQRIERVINSRDLIPWKDLSACFRASPRGLGVAFTTIQAWQTHGMPYVRHGHSLLFSWPEVWEWYKLNFHRGQEFPQCHAAYGAARRLSSADSS